MLLNVMLSLATEAVVPFSKFNVWEKRILPFSASNIVFVKLLSVLVESTKNHVVLVLIVVFVNVLLLESVSILIAVAALLIPVLFTMILLELVINPIPLLLLPIAFTELLDILPLFTFENNMAWELLKLEFP